MFIEGKPLNATDIAVGPDGAIYFCTGGRGTDGGVYRVRWTGQQPAEQVIRGEGIELALRQPQFGADWAKAQVAKVLQELGNQWPRELERVILDKGRTVEDRRRRLNLITYFGPHPSQQLLLTLSRDRHSAMRRWRS